MASVIEKQLHPFAAARAAGREPYKVADLSLAEFGRKEIEPGRAGNARLDGAAQAARRQEAARRHADHGQPAHDHSNGGADRDADRARRRRALGVVQHLLDPGSRGRGGRRRAPGDGRHGAESEGHAGVRVEGRDARRVLVVHERSGRVARRQRSDARSSTTAATRRSSCTGASSSRRPGNVPAFRARERAGRMGRHPRADPRVDGEGQDALDAARLADPRRQRGNDDRRAPAVSDAWKPARCSFPRSTSTTRSPRASSTTSTAAVTRCPTGWRARPT